MLVNIEFMTNISLRTSLNLDVIKKEESEVNAKSQPAQEEMTLFQRLRFSLPLSMSVVIASLSNESRKNVANLNYYHSNTRNLTNNIKYSRGKS